MTAKPACPQPKARICFHSRLRPLLHREFRQREQLRHILDRKASIKDIIESYNVPHTEIGSIQVNGLEKNFSYIVRERDHIVVNAHIPPITPCIPSLLRPNSLQAIRFLVDVNVAKLGSYLRMVGLDTLLRPELDDKQLAALAAEKGCILLSRDKGLLQRRVVEHGHLVRTEKPLEQLAEILHLYGLNESISPFSRCMDCNTILSPVSREMILQELEPLTRKYYREFSRCLSCGKLFWHGSHRAAMERLVAKALAMAR